MVFLLFCVLTGAAFAAVPPELDDALKAFRADPPPGWSFTQTTTAEGKSTVEQCDAAQPDFNRWSLVQQNGRPPTTDEARDYSEMRSRRSRGGTAPKLTDQFDLATLETVTDSPKQGTYRCRLKPGETGDETAGYLRATLVVDKTARALLSIELANTAPFSPTIGVKISELKTTMTYSAPAADRPTLPDRVTTHVRGRAFLVKSLDAEMTVVYSDYKYVFKPKK